MKYNVIFNQQQCLKFKLTVSEAALMDLLCELSSWAEEKIINGRAYYFLSRNKVIDELPFFFNKPDTVYRNFKALQDHKMVEYVKLKKKDYLRLSPKGKTWNYEEKNSDLNPNPDLNPKELGFESEKGIEGNSLETSTVTGDSSDLNPTDKYYKYTKDKSAIEVLKILEIENPLVFDIIFNSTDFNDRIIKCLKGYGLKFDFEKDVYPIFSKWVMQAYTANGLNLSTSNVRAKLTAYVISVMNNGGLNDVKKINNQPETIPVSIRKRLA